MADDEETRAQLRRDLMKELSSGQEMTAEELRGHLARVRRRGKPRAVTYRCSFCGKSQANVRKLIAGPSNVMICDECVDLCQEILDEELPERADKLEGIRRDLDALTARFDALTADKSDDG